MDEQRANYAIGLLYPIACALPKLSINALSLRALPLAAGLRVVKTARVTAYLLIVFLTANAIAFLIPSVLVCNPPAKFWQYPPQSDKCFNTGVLGTWISLPNLISDVVMLVLPLPMVWHLHADHYFPVSLIRSGCARSARVDTRSPAVEEILQW